MSAGLLRPSSLGNGKWKTDIRFDLADTFLQWFVALD